MSGQKSAPLKVPHQLSYDIKTQLKAPIGVFLAFSCVLMASGGSIVGALMPLRPGCRIEIRGVREEEKGEWR